MASVIFLGFSAIMFIVTYGILFLITPLIFNAVFVSLEGTSFLLTYSEWQAQCPGGVPVDPDDTTMCDFSGIYYENAETVEFLVPLMLTIGIFLLVIKILMAASSKGGD